MIYTPTEAEVARVQRTTGMDSLQAYRHCQARAAVLQRIEQDHQAAVRRCIEAWAHRESAEVQP